MGTFRNVIFRKSVPENSKNFLAPCLHPVDLKMSLKLMEKNTSIKKEVNGKEHQVTRILFMTSSQFLNIFHGIGPSRHSYIDVVTYKQEKQIFTFEDSENFCDSFSSSNIILERKFYHKVFWGNLWWFRQYWL